MAPPTATLPQSFNSKKRKILEALAVPISEYDDLSPKGSIDEGIRDLIDEINLIEGCVTTSSCAGRVSVFLEGKKSSGDLDEEDEDEDEEGGEVKTRAGVGGKGGGGRWLYVSHNSVSIEEYSGFLVQRLGMVRVKEEPPRDPNRRFIHFKFEPMILHILTASLEQAQIVLSAALQAGFRESGALNLVSSSNKPATPMVAVRSMGLGLESLIGYEFEGHQICSVPERDLKTLLEISNERFKVNTERILRFQLLLRRLSNEAVSEGKRKGQQGDEWEDPQARRERKKAEGLMRRQQLKKDRPPESSEDSQETAGLDLLDQNT